MFSLCSIILGEKKKITVHITEKTSRLFYSLQHLGKKKTKKTIE